MVAFGLVGQPALSQADADSRPARYGQGCEQSGKGMEGRGFECMAIRLDLSAEQINALKVIEAKYGPEMRKLGQMAYDNRNALDNMDASDPKLEALATAQGKIIGEMMIVRKKMRFQMDRVLTDAQRQKLTDLFEQSVRQRVHHGDRREGMDPA
jgi:Spy/CpxP family protein refolding chaperone